MTETLTPFYEKEVRCLNCEKLFHSRRVRSRFLRVQKVHPDFYVEYKDPSLNPYFYEIDVCPACGFASADTFEPGFPPGTKALIEQQFQQWKEQDFNKERTSDEAIRALKLGVLSAVLKKEKHVVIAGLCLRLAWIYRLEDQAEEEIRFLRQALNHYQFSYEQADFVSTQMSEMRMLYLIGELARRVGNIDEAIRYFSRVIQHKNKAFEQKLVEMAREQWYIIRGQEETVVSQ